MRGPTNRSGVGSSPDGVRVPDRGSSQRTPGQFRGSRFGRPSDATVTPGGRPPRGGTDVRQPRRDGAPGQVPGPAAQRGGRGQGPSDGRDGVRRPGGGRQSGGQGLGGRARQQWNQNWNKNRGSWNRHGNWNKNNHWNWNDSSFSFGLFFYPGFASAFNYGYWGFNDCGAYCTYSPFYYYGMPYVYAPRVVVAEVPVYDYAPVPDYSYGTGYYLSQGSYSGLDAALDDIRSGWVNGRPDLILQHVNTGTQVAVYLDNNYAYSLSGDDYRNMVNDAAGNIRTVSFSIDNVERRSDGAYTATGTHDFYDVNGNRKVVNVSYTLQQQGGRWVIVATGSTEAV